MGTEATLSSAWDQHLASEFAAKSPEQALATMTAEPYVNVVALMIGARGRNEVRDFYAHHFLSQIPPDMEMVPVSRTIGQGRVVDELIMRFTHSIRMDWLLPGIAPTGKRVEVPFVAIVQFEGDKVAHEHIYWDQASVLVQVGLLDRTLPVRGGETAAQVLNPTQPMNELIRRAMTHHRRPSARREPGRGGEGHDRQGRPRGPRLPRPAGLDHVLHGDPGHGAGAIQSRAPDGLLLLWGAGPRYRRD